MMKFIITITSLLISIVSFSQNNGKATQGEFNGTRCAGSIGICYVTPPDLNNKSTTMKNYTTYKLSSNSLIIELDTNALNIDDQKKFFGKEYSKITSNETLVFVQDDDFIFDINTMIYLDLDLNYRLIKKGNYPLKIVNDKVQVTITLSPYK